MKRQIPRYALWGGLLLSTAFAMWSGLRPYSWHSDPGARCEVVETLLTRDQSFFWVNVHLKMNPGMSHDMQKPIRLETAGGRKLEPADITLGAQDGREPPEIWVKFWLEATDLNGPLTLHLNDGKLQIKASMGIPKLETSSFKNFTTHQW